MSQQKLEWRFCAFVTLILIPVPLLLGYLHCSHAVLQICHCFRHFEKWRFHQYFFQTLFLWVRNSLLETYNIPRPALLCYICCPASFYLRYDKYDDPVSHYCWIIIISSIFLSNLQGFQVAVLRSFWCSHRLVCLLCRTYSVQRWRLPLGQLRLLHALFQDAEEYWRKRQNDVCSFRLKKLRELIPIYHLLTFQCTSIPLGTRCRCFVSTLQETQ